MPKPIKYLFDGPCDNKHYARATKEGRREIAVLVWLNKLKPEGEPDGDWIMPGVLGLAACIAQAVLQTE